MKSADYSAKGVFLNAFKSVARRQLPGAVVAAAICALLSVIYSTYCGISCTGVRTDITYEVQAWGLSVLFAVAVYCAVATGVMYNAYFSHRGCDYQLALPYKRSHIYNANFLFGLITICFSIIISVGIFALITGSFMGIKANNDVAFTVDSVVYKQAATIISALLSGYSLCSMCAAVSGKWLQYAAFCLVGIISVPITLIGIAMGINSVWGIMIDVYLFSGITPFGVLTMLFRDTTDSSFVFMTAVSLAEFILMYFAGLIAFKRRKSEIAESGYGDSIIKYILMVIFTVSGFLYFGIQNNILVSLVVGAIVAFMCAFLFSIMQIQRKKVFTKKSGIVFGVTAAVCIVFTLGIHFSNSSSFVKYVPNAEDIESVTVTEYDDYSQYDSGPAWYLIGILSGPVSESKSAVFTEPQNIQSVVDFHNLVVSDKVMNYTLRDRERDLYSVQETTTVPADTEEAVTEPYNEDITSSLSFDLVYKLKNGKTVKRSYIIQYNLWDEYLKFMKSEEAITQNEPYSLSAEDVMYVETIFYSQDPSADISGDADYDYYVIPPEKWDELRASLVLDKLNEPNGEFYYGGLGNAYMTVYTLDDNIPEEQKEYIRSMTPEERRDYAAKVNGYMLSDPEKYPVFPFNSYDVNVSDFDERTIKLLESSEMQQYIIE